MISLDHIKELSVQPLSSSSKQQLYIIGYHKRYFEVSKPVADLVEILKNSNSLNEVSETFSKKNGIEYSNENIEVLIDKYIAPIFKLTGEKTNSYIWLQKKFISQEMLQPITRYLSYLFKPGIAIPIFLSIVYAQFYVFFLSPVIPLAEGFNISTFIFIGLLFFISIIFHELGHASACKYYGVGHGHIGMGLYLHFPVFYTDVTNVWTLKRTQRIIIDLAGIYFQLIFLLPVILTYSYTNTENLKYLIYTINLSFLFNLNPFFRFDGYWVFTDLLGIANLRKRTYESTLFLIQKLQGKKGLSLPYLFKIKNKEKFVFIGYVILLNFFFGYYILYRLPHFFYNFIKTVPTNLKQFFNGIYQGNTFQFELAGSIIMQGLLLLVTFYIIYKVSLKIYHFAVNRPT